MVNFYWPKPENGNMRELEEIRMPPPVFEVSPRVPLETLWQRRWGESELLKMSNNKYIG